MNKKNATIILIMILLGNLVVRLSFISFWSTRLLDLLSDNILNGNLFQAHILSPRSSRFWFQFIDCLIPHAIILTGLVGIFQYFKSAGTSVNKYLILTIILSYFPLLPEFIVWLMGILNPSFNFFFYDSTWSLLGLILHYIGFIYVAVYFSIFNRTDEAGEENANVTGNLAIRFKNYLADTVYLIYIALGLLQLLSEKNETDLLILYLSISVLYYFYCEYLFAQSIGKSMTNTFVIFSGHRLAGSVIRTLARRIPFEPFSFLFSQLSGGWHDKLSKSQVTQSRLTKKKI